jgi:hypothetical protein
MKIRPSPWILLAGDLLCLAAFVLFGLGTHDVLAGTNALQRFLINAGPMALVWTVAAGALGAFRFAAPTPMRTVWARTLTAWLVAAPLALLLRAQLLGAATLVINFVLVTLGVGGSLLLLWRTVYAWLALRTAA